MKQCTKCLKFKRETSFYKHKLGKNGLRSKCKVCSNAEHKSYVENNRERIRQHDLERHIRHRPMRLKMMKTHHRTNRVYISKRKSIYGQVNKKRLNGVSSLKRQRLKQATPKWLTDKQKKRIITIYEKCPDGYHVDHIVPIKGLNVMGLHVPWNLRYLSRANNLAKYNKY